MVGACDGDEFEVNVEKKKYSGGRLMMYVNLGIHEDAYRIFG